jgi:predicted negative regulator of RcsB-dependent stress response
VERYESDKEQIETLKRWWRDNGTALILGLAIGLAALFGWRYYNERKIAVAEQASTTYDVLLRALQADDMKEAAVIGERIMTEHTDSSYSVLAALLLAKAAEQQTQLDEAKQKLRWAAEHAESPELKRIAIARIARMLLSEGQADAAWKELVSAGVIDVDGFYELRGDILAAQGKSDEARAMYLKVLAQAEAGGLDTRGTQLKYDNLATRAN